VNHQLLSGLAAKYIWWKPPELAMEQPLRVAAQVMELGDWDDVVLLSEAEGDEFLRDVLRHAEPGQLSERSWNYWHYRLGLAEPGQRAPAPPRREFA
jgi:hypothetical protein